MELGDDDELYAEKLDLLPKIRSERVTWSGRLRPLNDAGIYPRSPARSAPRMGGVGGSPQSVVRAEVARRQADRSTVATA